MIKDVAVVAGNNGEFRYFVGEKARTSKSYRLCDTVSYVDDVRYIYVSSADTLRGLRNYELEIIGTGIERPNIAEILDESRFGLG